MARCLVPKTIFRDFSFSVNLTTNSDYRYLSRRGSYLPSGEILSLLVKELFRCTIRHTDPSAWWCSVAISMPSSHFRHPAEASSGTLRMIWSLAVRGITTRTLHYVSKSHTVALPAIDTCRIDSTPHLAQPLRFPSWISYSDRTVGRCAPQ